METGFYGENGNSGKTGSQGEVRRHGKDGIMRIVHDSLAAAADIIVPRYCCVCGRRLLSKEKHICLFCMGDFPFTYNWKAPRNGMADRFNALICADAPETAADSKEPYAYAAALFLYSDDAPYREIQHRLKYKGDIGTGRYFARMLGERLVSASHFRDADTVIPVPLHPMRKWARGYNQAEVIAREIAICTGAGLCTDLLLRSRHTRTQTKLSTEEKMQNVRNAFSVRRKDREKLLSCRHIILVDDIFTTGATMYSCFRTIREAARETGPDGREDSVIEMPRISVVSLGLVDR